MNLLEVKTLDLSTIQDELEHKIQKAPAFFANAPLVIGFEMLPEQDHANFDLAGLIRICKQLQLLPAASRGGNDQLQQLSIKNELATIAKGREKHVGVVTEKPSLSQLEGAKTSSEQAVDASNQKHSSPTPANSETQTVDSPKTISAPTKVISTPIRSGQQIYAPGGDLIVLSSVSAGAEVLADGNIHIYGALRGRALAGVKGDGSARIFCSSQEAELISIAGHFLVDDQLKSTHWKEAVQIHATEDNIAIQPLQ